jgi:hypothetical protein
MEGWEGPAVWADDDTEIAGVYEYYEGQETATHTKKRNIDSVVHLFAGIGEASYRQILPRSPGRVDQLFYMRNADYVIVRRQDALPDLTQGMTTYANFHVDKVSTGGQVTNIGTVQATSAISCDAAGNSSVATSHPLSVFPSPDGFTLAKVEVTATCDGQSAQLTFLRAETLAVLDGPFAIFAPDDVNNVPTFAWLPNGRFAAIGTFFGLRGESYAPRTPMEEIQVMNYDCFFPSTTSSDVDANGRNVWMGSNGRPIVEEPNAGEPPPRGVAFGCPDF